MVIIVLPDVISPAIRYLNTVVELVAEVDDRIGTRVGPPWPAIRLDLTGGITRVEQRIDQPRIQVHAFAETDADARRIAYIAKAAFVAFGGYREPGVIVVGWVETSTPQLLTDLDREPPISHATFAATCAVRPDP